MLKTPNKQTIKHILTELIPVTIVLTICLIICIIIFGFENFRSGNFDINLHDTYFVITSGSIISIIFLPLFFFSLLIRTIFYYFKNKVINILLIGTTALMIFLTTIAIKELSKFSFIESGWAIYPPLSALPQEVSQNGSSSIFSDILTVVQLFLISTLIAICILTGKNR